MPWDLDTFIHRSGRTGRNGEPGNVYMIADSDDNRRFNKYSRDILNVKTLNFLPSEIYKNKKIIDQAKKMESE